jgi:serine/threonine protein kinase
MVASPANLPEVIASRYRTIRLIAAGGMGAVYEVEHMLTGEHLALKVLWSNANASPDALARFKHEVRASARIKSENVVRVTDADVSPELGGAPFLVMELLRGTDLEHAAAADPPTPMQVIEWLRQVARAIDKAHSLGIVHRDLKPENLFLVTRNEGPPLVKILDFGIVKMIEEGTGATGSGQILGTPKYMAPEQASASGPISPATDRCALGLIAYRLLMGESYYQGGIMIILGQLLHGVLEPPKDRGSRFGDAFDAWFLKACHRDPGQRFPSASDQVEALAAALGLPTVSIAVPRPSPFNLRIVSKGPQRALWIGTSIAAVLVAGIVAARKAIVARRSEPLVCGLPNRGVTSACGSCMAQACCQDAEACSETEGCAKIEACVRACASGNAVCRAGCYAGKGDVAPRQQGVETCRATACANECLPAPWSCLGQVKWDSHGPIPQKIWIKSIAICTSCGAGGLPVAGGPGGSPIAGVGVRACSLADPSCVLPLSTGATDDGGAVALSIDTSLYKPPLSIFLEYRKKGYADTLVQLSAPPVSADIDLGRVVIVDPKIDPPSASATALEPTRAVIALLARDCNGQPATQKSALTWLDADAATVTSGYFAPMGMAAAVNMPVNVAGITRVVARVAETNQLIATASVVVRPGAKTEVRLAPTP